MFQNISAASNVKQIEKKKKKKKTLFTEREVKPKGFETWKYQQLCSPSKYPVLAKKSHTIHRFSRMLQPRQSETWSEPKIIWRPLNWVFKSSSKRWWSCCFIFDTPQKDLEQNLALSHLEKVSPKAERFVFCLFTKKIEFNQQSRGLKTELIQLQRKNSSSGSWNVTGHIVGNSFLQSFFSRKSDPKCPKE